MNKLIHQVHGKVSNKGENKGVHQDASHCRTTIGIYIRITDTGAKHIGQLICGRQRDEKKQQTVL